jgi:transcriptional regulator GlxA family with amidase domain
VRNVAILIFDDAEVLDFCGPFEVFSVTRLPDETPAFNVYTVAERAAPVRARNGLSINPAYTLTDCPPPDLLLIPGGQGARREIDNPILIDWIKAQADRVELLLSVCTGSLLLARAGLLADRRATTYHTAFDLLATLSPSTELCPGLRYVDNGRIITSAGISAGIDMSLYIVGRLHGEAVARATARHMEYFWQPGQVENPV